MKKLLLLLLLLSGCTEEVATKPNPMRELGPLPENWTKTYGDSDESKKIGHIAWTEQVTNNQARVLKVVYGNMVDPNTMNDLVERVERLENSKMQEAESEALHKYMESCSPDASPDIEEEQDSNK